MTSVRIEAQGLSEVSAALEWMASSGIRLRPLMERIGVYLIASVHDNFAAEGRPEKWKPLSPSTIRSYEMQATQAAQSTQRYQNAKTDATRMKIIGSRIQSDVGGHKILVRSGALRGSIMVGNVTNTDIEIGVPRGSKAGKYARIQQLGGKIGPITIRPRNKQALLIPTDRKSVV